MDNPEQESNVEAPKDERSIEERLEQALTPKEAEADEADINTLEAAAGYPPSLLCF